MLFLFSCFILQPSHSNSQRPGMSGTYQSSGSLGDHDSTVDPSYWVIQMTRLHMVRSCAGLYRLRAFQRLSSVPQACHSVHVIIAFFKEGVSQKLNIYATVLWAYGGHLLVLHRHLLLPSLHQFSCAVYHSQVFCLGSWFL